jgi:hypothetical protein
MVPLHLVDSAGLGRRSALHVPATPPRLNATVEAKEAAEAYCCGVKPVLSMSSGNPDIITCSRSTKSERQHGTGNASGFSPMIPRISNLRGLLLARTNLTCEFSCCNKWLIMGAGFSNGYKAVLAKKVMGR